MDQTDAYYSKETISEDKLLEAIQTIRRLLKANQEFRDCMTDLVQRNEKYQFDLLQVRIQSEFTHYFL